MPPIYGLCLVNVPPSNRGLRGKILGASNLKLGAKGAFPANFSKFFKKFQHRNAIKSEVYRFLRIDFFQKRCISIRNLQKINIPFFTFCVKLFWRFCLDICLRILQYWAGGPPNISYIGRPVHLIEIFKSVSGSTPQKITLICAPPPPKCALSKNQLRLLRLGYFKLGKASVLKQNSYLFT